MKAEWARLEKWLDKLAQRAATLGNGIRDTQQRTRAVGASSYASGSGSSSSATMDYLKLVEAEQRIQSADAVFDRALAAGRTPSRVEKFGEHDPALREAVRDTLRAAQRDRKNI